MSGPDRPARGYDPDFLGLPVPLPVRSLAWGPALVLLPYTHFSVLLDPERRLAAATAVTIDGATLRALPRTGIPWRLDPRVREQDQAGEQLYARNDLDRRHLVRRSDPCWGSEQEARQANADTFSYPNAAPQAAQFNQGKDLWLGLEDHLLEHAATHTRRLVVLTGPVLDPHDPPYRGVRIPLLFWKVAAVRQDDQLAATAYVLDQSPLLPDLPDQDRPAAAAQDPPPLGPYRTYQVPVLDVAALTGLDLGPLPAADRYRPPADVADRPGRRRWTPLTSYADVTLAERA